MGRTPDRPRALSIVSEGLVAVVPGGHALPRLATWRSPRSPGVDTPAVLALVWKRTTNRALHALVRHCEATFTIPREA